jgi:hypothetical protein
MTLANPVGTGLSAANRNKISLIITSAGATNTVTFGANYVLQANTGQAGQVLTPGTAALVMVLEFQFNGSKWIQMNGAQAWN